MVTDKQIKKLRKLMSEGSSLSGAAAKVDMDEKTARKYLREKRLPSECRPVREYRTRPDPFEGAWDWVRAYLENAPGLEAKTLFDALQREHPGRYSDGQLRTFQRHVKRWRGIEGPPQEVYFMQQHHPGEVSASDFTCMSSLGITIGGQAFDHLVYHFVLTYSNWESGTICFSESFESLSQGLQNALWELGGIPLRHRTDQLSSAVHQAPSLDVFTRRYRGLLDHYGLDGERTGVRKPNENGDVEQSHYRFKKAVEQALLLRGSKDFQDRREYTMFICRLFARRNAGRKDRIAEEQKTLRPLPKGRLETRRRLDVRVGQGSTIRILRNTYSVHSRLIGEKITIRLGPEDLEIWYGQSCVDRLPRLRGEKKYRIDYRHIIDWLVRKPGAFMNYAYREDLFPTSRFRMAYDEIAERDPGKAARIYLEILHLAATESESGVDDAIRLLIAQERPITAAAVEAQLNSESPASEATDVRIESVDLIRYDDLLRHPTKTAVVGPELDKRREATWAPLAS